MSTSFVAAVVQLTSTSDEEANWQRASRLGDRGAAAAPGGEGEETVCGQGGVVVADTALGRIGMSICYDLRFGELYRRVTELGAQMLTVPSAFTLATGKDHWEPLLRARAIENQCYVLAPAQHGAHDDG